MDSRIIFLVVLGVFCGCCFVVGCTASIIKAVKDRRRILKNLAEKNGIEDKEAESENHKILKRSNKTNDFQRSDSGLSDRRRRSGISGTLETDKLELDYGSMEKSGNVGNVVPLSVIEERCGAHSQATNLVLNDEKLSDQEKEKEEVKESPESHGTFVANTDPPVARTRSYQVAMTKNLSIEQPSSLGHSDPDWSSRENILKIDI